MSIQTRIEAKDTASMMVSRPHGFNHTIPAAMNYIVRAEQKPAIRIDDGGIRGKITTPPRQTRFVGVTDIRGRTNDFTLEKNGFSFIKSYSAVRDFRDQEQIRTLYERELQKTLWQTHGAKEIHIFDHTIRLDNDNDQDRKPVRHVHGDYTQNSGMQRIRDLLGDDIALEWAAGHFAIVNVWRSINGPVEQSPLAFIDAASIAPQDLVATDLIYPDRVGEIFEVAYNENHDWVYLSGMDATDAVVFNTFDSRDDGIVRIAPHSAFDIPADGYKPRARQSIESRALVRLS